MRLTEEETARRAATTRERVRELVELGIVGQGSDPDEPFRRGDVLRVELFEELETFGISPKRVAAAISAGALSLSYLDRFPDPSPRSGKTHTELCDELGIPFRLLDRIYAGFGLARPQSDERVREEDLAIISELPLLFSAGLGAVLGSLDFVETAEPLGLPPARVGVNAGPMTYTDGDYYGLTVIIAARIAAQAGPRQVLVGEAATASGSPKGVRFEEIGPVPLKGVARPVIVYRALREAT